MVLSIHLMRGLPLGLGSYWNTIDNSFNRIHLQDGQSIELYTQREYIYRRRVYRSQRPAMMMMMMT